MEESVITEEVMRDYLSYYGKVYQRTRQTRQEIQALEKRKSTNEALRCIIEDQIALEIAKLHKLEQEAHQWVQQAIPNLEKVDIICPQMKRLLETAEEKD